MNIYKTLTAVINIYWALKSKVLRDLSLLGHFKKISRKKSLEYVVLVLTIV